MKPVIIIAIAFVLLIPVPVFAEISITNNGGDCSKIGTWNSTSKTCTLNIDTSESILVNANYITLDGNNHQITGNDDNSSPENLTCISIDAKIEITIKNFKLTKCGWGIYFKDVLDSTFIENEIYDNYIGGISFTLSNNNIIKNNKIYDNYQSGISFNGNGNLIEGNKIINNTNIYNGTRTGWGIHEGGQDSANIFLKNTIKDHVWGLNFDGVNGKNQIQNNKISGNEVGLRLNTSQGFVIENNVMNTNDIGISSYMYDGSGGRHTIQGNIISENIVGIYLDSGYNVLTENTIISNSEYGLKLLDIEQRRYDHNNQIFNNNFIDNSKHVIYGEKNLFTVNGFGNYWDGFSSHCTDVNSDKVCDEPYPFSSGTVGIVDNGVWVEKDGWLILDLIETILEYEIMQEWVREVFVFWDNGDISDVELTNAIAFLVDIGVIVLDN